MRKNLISRNWSSEFSFGLLRQVGKAHSTRNTVVSSLLMRTCELSMGNIIHSLQKVLMRNTRRSAGFGPLGLLTIRAQKSENEPFTREETRLTFFSKLTAQVDSG